MSRQGKGAAWIAAPRGQTAPERRIRLATGLVLFAFVLTHLALRLPGTDGAAHTMLGASGSRTGA